MEKIFNNVTELIGKTPLVRVNHLDIGKAEVLAKLEYTNPGSSVKDRIAYSMITNAEKDGTLTSGSIIIEPTSGNTGIGLAIVSAVKGYKLILTMPESMSIERRKLLISLGAEIVLTDANEGMQGAIDQAVLMSENMENVFIPQQFANKYNPQIHYETTGPEIWGDCGGEIDYFVSAVGTGGTVSGVGKFLKEKNPDIKIIAVEPIESHVMSGGKMGAHMIQGIGAGFIPDTLDMSVVDEVVTVESRESIAMAKACSKHDSLIMGISSGANVLAAKRIAERHKGEEVRIVTIACDTGERYISTLLYHED